MKARLSPLLTRRILSLLLVAICIATVVNGLNPHRPRSKGPQQISLSIGRYVGSATNTTSSLSIDGRVTFDVLNFEESTGQIKVGMLFSNGLCGGGSFSGIVDEEGVSLSGKLTSTGATCGNQSWDMVTRCKSKGSHALTCSYRLSHERNSSSNQKGVFEVARASIQQPIVPKSTSRSRVAPSSPSIGPKSNRRVEFPKEDPGVDLAVVIVIKANLRDGPSLSNAIVMEAEQDDLLVLVDRAPVGPWYNVVHVESSNEGWINGNAIEVKFTQNRKQESLLEERSTGSGLNPYIEVTNDSDKTLYLKIGNSRYVINPHATKTIDLVPGTYKYYASSPGIIPAFGEDVLTAGHGYTWQFYIVTVPGE